MRERRSRITLRFIRATAYGRCAALRSDAATGSADFFGLTDRQGRKRGKIAHLLGKIGRFDVHNLIFVAMQRWGTKMVPCDARYLHYLNPRCASRQTAGVLFLGDPQ
jgi:hypothetical protein